MRGTSTSPRDPNDATLTTVRKRLAEVCLTRLFVMLLRIGISLGVGVHDHATGRLDAWSREHIPKCLWIHAMAMVCSQLNL